MAKNVISLWDSPEDHRNKFQSGGNKNAIEAWFDEYTAYGIQGLLDEQYIDLSTQVIPGDIELPKTYSLGISGMMRFKLPESSPKIKAIYENLWKS